jgi:predicted AlkP superfamily pyrophosphatase or phosphodiesterase
MRTCVIDLPGLNGRLLDRLPAASKASWVNELENRGRCVVRPVLPAVTMTAQATFTTGKLPAEHGVVANGFAAFRQAAMREHFDLDSYAEYRSNVSFWEQSNALLKSPRIWQTGDKRTAALLFVQSSIGGAADVVVTPKPSHTPDGRTVSDCFSQPADLYGKLKQQLGDFPLHHYWGPMAGMKSSEWIATAARIVWETHPTDLMWVYVPQLDYDLQRFGPSDERCVAALAQTLALLTPLVEKVTADDGRVLLLSEYGLTGVSRSTAPNAALRKAGLLKTRPGAGSSLEVDYAASAAFAMVDHQVAHVYCRDVASRAQVRGVLSALPEIQHLYEGGDRAKVGLDSDRAGDIVAFTYENAWFEYRWWDNWAEAPAYAWTVDIHSKPGYDPTELFADFKTRKTLADRPEMVKGSHGTIPENEYDWPLLLGCPDAGGKIDSTQVAKLI